MRRSRLKILAYLGSEVLILLGVFFIVCMNMGLTKDLPPGPRAITYARTVLVFSLVIPAVLILTRGVIWLRKSAETESEGKTDVDALCEHLRQIGLNATVESKQPSRFRTLMATAIVIYVLIFVMLWMGFLGLFVSLDISVMVLSVGILIFVSLMLLFFDPRPSSQDSFLSHSLSSSFMGSVRVANRNIDLIELQWWEGFVGEGYDERKESRYECSYVVQVKIEGLEDRLKAKTRPITVKKGFLSREIVDFGWEGGELAHALNNDANLRDTLHRMKDRDMKDRYTSLDARQVFLFFLETKPDRKHECVRIAQEGGAFRSGYASLESAFPTVEIFDVYDRIAQHIRSIANISH